MNQSRTREQAHCCVIGERYLFTTMINISSTRAKRRKWSATINALAHRRISRRVFVGEKIVENPDTRMLLSRPSRTTNRQNYFRPTSPSETVLREDLPGSALTQTAPRHRQTCQQDSLVNISLVVLYGPHFLNKSP